jgi:hypothetical protein
MSDGFHMFGDKRDIPMSLGLVVIGWNACELACRELVKTLATGGQHRSWRLAEVLISELGSVGLTQALQCYAREFPSEQKDLARAVRHIADVTERLRAYRNYFVHGITNVTHYGFDVSEEMIERDAPITEALIEGPFAHIYQKSAKGRSKFVLDHVKAGVLADVNRDLVRLKVYIDAVSIAVGRWLRGADDQDGAPLPEPPPLPDVLVKPEIRHPKAQPPPGLGPRKKREED